MHNSDSQTSVRLHICVCRKGEACFLLQLRKLHLGNGVSFPSEVVIQAFAKEAHRKGRDAQLYLKIHL